MNAEWPLIAGVTEEMLAHYRVAEGDSPDGIGPHLPNRSRVVEALDQLLDALLPAGFVPDVCQPELLRQYLSERLSRAFRLLSVEIRHALPLRWHGAYAQHRAAAGQEVSPPLEPAQLADLAVELGRQFVGTLPRLRELLTADIQAAYRGDPAAVSYAEVMLCYPGVRAIAAHRLAHELQRLDIPVVPRIISEHMHSRVGVDIHPGAEIGSSFFIDHATGVVIGETARVGHNVKLYQGVTLGARSFPLDEHGFPQKGISRHPVVEDNVVIYANATILGPITIGAGSEIGGNVFVTESVPPGSRVASHNELRVKARRDL